MDTMTQPTASSAAAMLKSFDGDAFVEKVIAVAAEQIRAGLAQLGLTDATEISQVVEHDLAGALRPATGDRLVAAIHDVAARIDSRAATDAELLSTPRYVNAPEVTGWLHLKASDGERSVTVDSRKVTLPAGWLARQDRARLQEAAEWDADREWIARELELVGDHHGPCALDFEVDEGADLLTEWLAATETQD